MEKMHCPTPPHPKFSVLSNNFHHLSSSCMQYNTIQYKTVLYCIFMRCLQMISVLNTLKFSCSIKSSTLIFFHRYVMIMAKYNATYGQRSDKKRLTSEPNLRFQLFCSCIVSVKIILNRPQKTNQNGDIG